MTSSTSSRTSSAPASPVSVLNLRWRLIPERRLWSVYVYSFICFWLSSKLTGGGMKLEPLSRPQRRRQPGNEKLKAEDRISRRYYLFLQSSRIFWHWIVSPYLLSLECFFFVFGTAKKSNIYWKIWTSIGCRWKGKFFNAFYWIILT